MDGRCGSARRETSRVTGWLCACVAALLVLASCERAAESPAERLDAAVRRAARAGTPAAYAEALELALMLDEWSVGLELARDAEAAVPDPDAKLRGLVALGFWRAGRLAEAEQAAVSLPADTREVFALEALLRVHMGRGELAEVRQIADRVAETGLVTGPGYLTLISARILQGGAADLSSMLRQARAHISARYGLQRAADIASAEGLANLLDQVGDEPLNHVSAYGSAEMPVNQALRLPTCRALLNGRGPFRLVLDSGAGNVLFVNRTVAERIGLEIVGSARGYGFGGQIGVGLGLLDEVRIGQIACRRVLTNSPDERSAILMMSDGVIGTGVFGEARVELDFERARLRVSPSSAEPGQGHECLVRVAGGMHLLAEAELAGTPVVALLDTGASVPLISLSWLEGVYPDRTFPDCPLPAFGFGADPVALQVVSAGELLFAGRRIDGFAGMSVGDLDRVFGSGLGVQIDLLIGMTMFSQISTCSIDYPRRLMWIEWLEE